MKFTKLLRLSLVHVLFFTFQAFATLQVKPTRLMVDDQEKATRVAIKNLSQEKKAYRISVVFYRMDDKGNVALVDKPGENEKPAHDMFRYSPRKISLSSGQEQVVRIMLRKKANLPDGDYRAHILFNEIEDPDAVQPRTKDLKQGEVSMRLEPRIAVAVPIIYRHGQVNVEIKLSQLKLISDTSGKVSFSVAMDMKGNGFAYGNFRGFYIDPSGKSTEAVSVDGVSCYLSHRTVTYPLAIPGPQSKGKFRLEFHEPEEENAKILDAIEVGLGPAQK